MSGWNAEEGVGREEVGSAGHLSGFGPKEETDRTGTGTQQIVFLSLARIPEFLN